jgi:hypothetical protein
MTPKTMKSSRTPINSAQIERVFAPLCRWIPAYNSPSVSGHPQRNP